MKHIKFNRINIPEKGRKKREYKFPRKVPDKNNVKQANKLQNSLDAQVNSTLLKSEKFKFDPYLVMKLELEPGCSLIKDEEDKLEYFGVKIINKETKELQVLFSNDLRLTNFKNGLKDYKDGKIAQTKIVHEVLFSKIKSISGWTKEDRVGENLVLEELNNRDYVDCYLWVFDTLEESKIKMKEFKDFVHNNDARICDDYVGESVVIARIKISGNIINKVLEHPLVYKVENTPKFQIKYKRIREVENTRIDDLEFDTSQLIPDQSSSICVIDSGIFMQHPLLRGVIGDSKTFYCSDDYYDDSNDYAGHGTAVASVCEYGDFKYDESFIPQIYLFNAKIHDGEYTGEINLWKKEIESQIGKLDTNKIEVIEKFSDDEITFNELLLEFPKEQRPYLQMVYSKYTNLYEKLIPNQMKDIVEYFYEGYGCRIYNLSQGYKNHVYKDGKPKAWACVLDELQNKYDIVFVVSTGNFYYEDFKDYKNIIKEYPDYFFTTNETRLIDPANSVNSITVGSMSFSNEVINSPHRLTKKGVSKRNNISSITRIGPGVNGAIKPDFIAYGGDRGINIHSTGDCYPDCKNKGLSKLLFNNDNNGIYSFDVGTSFAAPYISHILALILNKYPNASNNLLRAILASSAKIPLEIKQQVQQVVDGDNKIEKEFILRDKKNLNKTLYYTSGYGYPDKDNCLDSFENRVVLIADIKSDEYKITPDKMHVFEIPLPSEFRKAEGEKRVIISLAFNPPVRNTRLDYIGVSMDYKLIKGTGLNKVIEAYETQKGKSKEERENTKIPDKYKCNLKPGPLLRDKGTLQKSTFEFSRDQNFNKNDNLYLVVNAKYNWSHTPQRYAVVAVLESEDEDLKIYNTVYNRVQERIEIEQQVENRVRL